ncbi:MAG: hypothetical protein ACFB03_19805 [Paracoccaceae bacterium]
MIRMSRPPVARFRFESVRLERGFRKLRADFQSKRNHDMQRKIRANIRLMENYVKNVMREITDLESQSSGKNLQTKWSRIDSFRRRRWLQIALTHARRMWSIPADTWPKKRAARQFYCGVVLGPGDRSDGP